MIQAIITSLIQMELADFDNDVFDTLGFAKKVLPELPSHKLTVLTQALGLDHSDAHRAWCDAECTARLYLFLKMKNEQNI